MLSLLKNANVRESLFWMLSLITLLILSGWEKTPGFCLWQMMGIDFCPGCGIGRAIGLLLRGDFQSSFQAHWLGIPALLTIAYRIFQLIHQLHPNPKKLNHAG
jgi:hypothetical protein